MGSRQFLCLNILFGIILTLLLPVAAKPNHDCDLTDTQESVGIPMHCNKEEDCYQGQGVTKGISHINKDSVEAILCGRELSVNYMGVTYNFITYCYMEELGNASPPGLSQAQPDPKIIVASVGLALLLSWLI